MSAGPVKVFEVGPRDGLQNEKSQVSLTDKLWFVRGLIEAGVREMELGAFVRTERVPQMADTDEIFTRIKNKELDLGKARAWAAEGFEATTAALGFTPSAVSLTSTSWR